MSPHEDRWVRLQALKQLWTERRLSRQEYHAIRGQCVRKLGYGSDEEARAAAELCVELRGERLRVYLCEWCGAHHLTRSGAE